MTNGFKPLNLSQSTLTAISRMGFTDPTPVQSEAIPPGLEGRDVVAQARTGTGKTAAFGIPLVENARGEGANKRHQRGGGIEHLVLAPTRELANQITEELNQLAHGSKLRACAIYGGVGYKKQRDAVGPHGHATCVVACPGRLLDLLEKGWIDLSGLRAVVFDEADRMLDMGFIHDIRKIFKHIPNQRQTFLFSATLPDGVEHLARDYLNNPVSIQTSKGPTATPLTEQFEIQVHGEGLPHLITLLEREDPERALVFAKTKHTTKRIAAKLEAAGYNATPLQGNMSQSKRDRAMADLRSGKVRFLVATDVAARGIDVDELTHVIQFDMPDQPEDHVHRTGRTGRAGKDGRAFLFVPPNARKTVQAIERKSGVKLERYDLGELVDVPHHVANAGPKPRRYETITAGGQGGRSGGRRRGRR